MFAIRISLTNFIIGFHIYHENIPLIVIKYYQFQCPRLLFLLTQADPLTPLSSKHGPVYSYSQQLLGLFGPKDRDHHPGGGQLGKYFTDKPSILKTNIYLFR